MNITDLRDLMLNAKVPLDGYRIATGKHSDGRKRHRGHRVFFSRPAAQTPGVDPSRTEVVARDVEDAA